MGTKNLIQRLPYFCLSIVYVISIIFVFLWTNSIANAYTTTQINVASFRFADETASAITMNIAGTTLRFVRDTNPPQPVSNPQQLGAVLPPSYTFLLQGNTNDNCREGFLAGSFVQTPGTEQPAKITILATNMDADPPPSAIDASLTFFHRDGDKCTSQGVDSSIRVTNSFGAALSIPEDQRAAGTGTGVVDENTCDFRFDTPISWIICPVIEIGISATDKVFSDFIQPLMEDVPVSTNPTDGAYLAWQQFRLIGNIVLVGAMIAVVYAQIKGS